MRGRSHLTATTTIAQPSEPHEKQKPDGASKTRFVRPSNKLNALSTKFGLTSTALTKGWRSGASDVAAPHAISSGEDTSYESDADAPFHVHTRFGSLHGMFELGGAGRDASAKLRTFRYSEPGHQTFVRRYRALVGETCSKCRFWDLYLVSLAQLQLLLENLW